VKTHNHTTSFEYPKSTDNNLVHEIEEFNKIDESLSKLEFKHSQKAASFYNSYVGCHIIVALYHLNVIDQLDEHGAVEIEAIKKSTASDVDHVLKVAELLNIIETSDGQIFYTELGKDVSKNVGFFLWIVGGYSALLEKTNELIGANRPSLKGLIDGEYVALGSFECGKKLMRNTLLDVMQNLNYHKIADLGCGNAGRLIKFVNLKDDSTGVGIDISREAIQSAKSNIHEEGLENKIQLFCENIFNSLKDKSVVFPEVDVVTNFMVFHDILNMEAINDDIFSYFFHTFPNAEYYVIADTVKGGDYEKEDLPMFSVGFELIHKLMGVELFPLQYYIDYFNKSGLTIERMEFFGAPNTYIFLLKRVR